VGWDDLPEDELQTVDVASELVEREVKHFVDELKHVGM
jgi:hypothetical protein